MTYAASHIPGRIVTLCAIVGAVGCGKKETPFPPGIEPIEENQASWPSSASGEYPETIAMVSGESDDYVWVHARAYVHASISDTWLALQDPDVVVDRRRVAEWEAKYDVEPEWIFSSEIHQLVRDIVTIEYDTTWRHGIVSGSTAEPDVIGVRWQKTYGSALIDILEGSMVVEVVDDQITSIEIIEHLGAATTGTDTVEAFFTDLHADIVAFVDGRPLPEFD